MTVTVIQHQTQALAVYRGSQRVSQLKVDGHGRATQRGIHKFFDLEVHCDITVQQTGPVGMVIWHQA